MRAVSAYIFSFTKRGVVFHYAQLDKILQRLHSRASVKCVCGVGKQWMLVAGSVCLGADAEGGATLNHR